MPGLPPSNPQDRRHGNQWPLVENWVDLARMRQRSRVLCGVGGFGEGLLNSVVSYVVADGFSYNVVSKESLPDADPEAPGRQDAQWLKDQVAACQDVVDEFLAVNQWNGEQDHTGTAPIGDTMEAESCRRLIRDGEFYDRFFDGDRCLVVRFGEPEQAIDPPGATAGDGWSWGSRHRMEPHEDITAIEEYHFAYQDLATALQTGQVSEVGEIVPAAEVLHVKAPGTDRNVKRGLPLFRLDTADALERAARGQRATSLSAYIRACTAEYWKHATGTSTQVGGLAASLRTTTRDNPYTGASENVEQVRPGMVRRGPAGQEPVALPQDQSASFQAAWQGDLRQAATAFNAPEYLASGDASNANYASTKEAGTPFVRFVEGLQRLLRAAFLRVVWRALRWAAEHGRIEPRVLKLVDVQCEPPQVVVRNDAELAQTDDVLIGVGVKSVQTAQLERGLDPEVELANQLERKKQMGQMGPPQQPPAPEKPDAPPAPAPTPEAVQPAPVVNVHLPESAPAAAPVQAPPSVHVTVAPPAPAASGAAEPLVETLTPERDEHGRITRVVRRTELAPVVQAWERDADGNVVRIVEVKDDSGHEHAADGKFGSGGAKKGGKKKPAAAAAPAYDRAKTAEAASLDVDEFLRDSGKAHTLDELAAEFGVAYDPENVADALAALVKDGYVTDDGVNAEGDVVYRTTDTGRPARESKDASGHEHAADGKFGSGGAKKGDSADVASGTGGADNGGMKRNLQPHEEEAAKKAGLSPHAFGKLKAMVRPASEGDLKKPTMFLWHGTTAGGAKGIRRDDGLRMGSRGQNATVSPKHASQYPEDTGAHSLVLLRADTASLDVDPNDQVGDTVAEGLFPRQRYQSSCTVKKAEPVAVFNIEDAERPDAAIEALEKGDLAAALGHGAKITYLRKKRGPADG